VGERIVPWTAKEVREAVRLRRAGWKFAAVARLLGRGVDATKAAVARHDPPAPRPSLGRLRGRLLRLHARGYSDPEAARQLGVHPVTVMGWRRVLGLACNRDSPRQRARAARHCRAVTARAGKRTFREVQAEVWAARAAAAGWPDACTPAEVAALDLLCDRGPLPLADLARLRGRRDENSTCRVLVRLRRRGLVVRRDRGRPGHGGGGRAPSLYELAPGVGRHRPTRGPEDGPLPGVNGVRVPAVRRVVGG
jgi:hypothetical protein